ncbi:nucleotide disphospho-sugar-binding domain-containing protein [Streptomyces sp. NPDC059708]|uniref:nucleotide disphospho-sugar-binding domain-containing protein n=1 Tax=Streptomyces sp. NPDC059708 TaxID=3346916 RepID=UPI0036812FB1
MFALWNWPTHYYPLVPLAWSARAAGHEVVVATQPGLAATVKRSGLPVAAVGTDVDVPALMGRYVRRAARGGGLDPAGWEEMRRFGARNCWLNVAVCGAMAEGLWEFASRWRPDVIVHEPTTYAGPLVAARLGVPAVRHTWGIDFAYLLREFDEEALAPFREAWDLGPVETLGALTVDPCPPSLQLPDGGAVPVPARRLPMRYVPYNGPARVPGWLLEPRRRPRVCVTWGMSSGRFDPGQVVIDQAVRAVAGLGVEVVAAVAPADRDLLGPMPPHVRVVEGVPLHALLPTCDALVSQGGLGTVMTAVAAGIPQLLVPQTTDRLLNAERLTATGAGLCLLPDDNTSRSLRDHVDALLTDPAHTAAARRLKAEQDALPDGNAMVRLLPGALREAPYRSTRMPMQAGRPAQVPGGARA